MGDDSEDAGKVTVRLGFPDKTARDYEVEALKVLDQSLEEIVRRNMAPLFPFCLLKFRKEESRRGREAAE